MNSDNPGGKKASEKANSRRQKVIDEIRNKAEDFESNMSGFIAEFNNWSDLLTVRKPARKSGSYSNPRVTEMFRAVNALSSMEYRMLTAQDPYFDIVPMDLSADNGRLAKIQSTLETQLALTQHKRHLLKACVSKQLFGTVIVEEPREEFIIAPFGRRISATAFRPRSLLQVAFERNTSDIDLADWLSASDLVSKQHLRTLLMQDPEGEVWIKSEMEKAFSEDIEDATLSPFLQARLTSAGYMTLDQRTGIRDLMMYYGKLDTLNDGVEYVVGVINRKHLVRFHPARDQSGRRMFRVARWFEYELEPYSYGLGKLLSPLHNSLDANRQRVQDGVAFDTYGLWLFNRLSGLDPSDLKIRPNQLIPVDDMSALKRVEGNTEGIVSGLKLDEILKQEFRAASGATDTLQAIVTEATATETSLAQNEAIRNISVKAELSAESLVRQHLEIMHADNIDLMDEPIIVNVNGRPQRVYPNDLFADVDFRVKVTTDKDYKPERLKKLVELLQIITSVRNQNPQFQQVSIAPIVEEIARGLGVKVAELLPPAPAQVSAGMTGIPGGMPMSPGQMQGVQMTAPSIPPEMPESGTGAGPNIVSTPIGPVLGSQ